jgi:IclR family pca regulon transcriptional regulator
MSESRTVKPREAEDVKPSRAPEGMAGLAKGLAVIEAFETASSPLTVSDAARLTGITRAAARRCLLTLAELGYLTYDGKFFRPTLRMLRLGGAYLGITRLPVLAHPYLSAARDALGESVSLTVWDDGWSVFVDRAESGWMLAGGMRIGARLPAYCTATGRVLMAPLSDGEVAAVLDRIQPQQLTPLTLTDPAAIIASVAEVRRDGYSIVDGELEPGMSTLAVPVVDSRGRTVAALSVNGASARLEARRLHQEFLPVLIDCAAKIGRTQ